MKPAITIIGAGPGGYIAAIRAAQLGAQVTLIENYELGGVCLNWGCIPTKTLKATAEVMETAKRLNEFGLRFTGAITPDLTAIMARKQRVTQTLVGGIKKLIRKNRINLIKGKAHVIDPHYVRVAGREAATQKIESDKLILATGSAPAGLAHVPFDAEKILSSNDALVLNEIPQSLLIIGGGVIGAEFAFIFNQFGTAVTVVEALDRLVPLPSVDADMSKTLLREMKKKKIQVHLNQTVTKVEDSGKGFVRVALGPSPFVATPADQGSPKMDLEVEKVLVTTGRVPNTRGLGLEAIGFELDEKGWISVNPKLETNIADVYAIGDVLGPEKIMLAHVASAEGLVAVENCLGGSKNMDYHIVPSGIYTMPEVADVGLTEPQVQAQGLDYQTGKFLFRELGKSQAMGEIAGEVKIIAAKKSAKILGVHMIGPHATDLIAEATLALQLGATLKDVAATIHAHPSLAEALWEAANATLGVGAPVDQNTSS